MMGPLQGRAVGQNSGINLLYANVGILLARISHILRRS